MILHMGNERGTKRRRDKRASVAVRTVRKLKTTVRYWRASTKLSVAHVGAVVLLTVNRLGAQILISHATSGLIHQLEHQKICSPR